MKNMDKYRISKPKSPAKEPSSDPYDKQRFGTKGSEGNIYSNNYRDTSKNFIGGKTPFTS